jgi:hypothetical protein
LHYAVASQTVAEKTCAAPCAAAREDEAIWVKPQARPTRRLANDLEQIGVEWTKTPQRLTASTSWLELFPLAGADPDNSGVVLFRLDDERAAVDLSIEMLRLGNDRQEIASLQISDEQSLTLLRVHEPPFYSLLEALEPQPDRTIRAYVEQSAQVFAPVGKAHPFADRIRTTKQQWLLIDDALKWTWLKPPSFREVYDLVEFQLPGETRTVVETPLNEPFHVPLSFAPDSSEQAADLWVITADPMSQLEEFVCSVDDRLLQRLLFAVGSTDDGEVVVLKTRPSKGASPVVVIDADAYRSYLRIPHLFVPCGRRIHPPLRRDVVVRHLAADAKVVTWLAPDHDRSFKPYKIPESAFRPLSDWVDYVIDRNGESVDAWVQSHRFDFDSFATEADVVIQQRDAGKSKRDRNQSEKRKTRRDRGPAPEQAPAAAPEAEIDEPDFNGVDAAESTETSVEDRRAEWTAELLDLEEKFLEQRGDDEASRRPLWIRMAELQSVLAQSRDATLCWSHAVWNSSPPTSAWRDTWLRVVSIGMERDGLGDDAIPQLIKPDRVSDARPDVVAVLMIRAAGAEQAGSLRPHLNEIREFLEANEATLPVRVCWLAWVAYVECADDPLALARARDRLLERLFQNGLRPETDLPTFLLSSEVESQQVAQVREVLGRLSPVVHRWIDRQPNGVAPPSTKSIANLQIAFGLARMGDVTLAGKLQEEALSEMTVTDPVNDWIYRAFAHRIEQAMNGEPARDPLPAELLNELNEPRFNQSELGRTSPRYFIDRLRGESRILEPHERINAFRRIYSDDFQVRLVALYDTHDRAVLKDMATQLLNSTFAGNDDDAKVAVLAACLEISPRVGESFALQLLELLDQALAANEANSGGRAKLYKQASLAAAHFGHPQVVRQVLNRFTEEFLAEPSENSLDALDTTFSTFFDGMRKLGLQAEMEHVFQAVQAIVGDSAGRKDRRASPPARARDLKLLIQVAAWRFYFDQNEWGGQLLNQARKQILGPEFTDPKANLRSLIGMIAPEYVSALTHAPMQTVVARLEDFFKSSKHVCDAMHTTIYYSRAQLGVVEAAVLALVTDGALLSDEGRRWLDEDEHAIRRRVHADVRQLQIGD